jgi:phage gp36-like protein
MSYSTQAQIVIACGGQAVYDQLFDYDGDGVGDADVLAQAQAYADGLINTYLWLRYQTVANPSPILQMLSADEAVYYAKKYKPRVGVSPDDVTQHELRLKTLESMRTGALRPDDPAPPPSSAAHKAAFVESCSPISRRRSKGVIW